MAQTHPDAPSLADPDDLLSLARYWYRKRRFDCAARALDAAEERVLGQSQQGHLAELRGRIHKRERRYQDAHNYWEKLAQSDPNRVEAAEELAKHLEHRLRDYNGALKIVDQALDRLRMRETLNDDNVDLERQRLMHRRARLVRRLKSKKA
jgi:tetratricopeptide (TPR) repeat protein